MLLFQSENVFIWLDYIILVLLLVGVIIGLKKGFVDQLFSMIGIVAVVIGAVALCSTVANTFLSNESGAIFDNISSFVQEKLANWEYYSTTPIVWSDTATNEEIITQAITLLGIPAVFVKIGIFDGVFQKFPTTESTLESHLPKILTQYVNYAVAFIILFIIFAIVVFLLKRTLKKIVSLPIINVIDKFLGVIFGLAKNLMVIISVFVFASFLSTLITPIANFLSSVVYEKSWFGQTLIQPIVEWIISLLG